MLSTLALHKEVKLFDMHVEKKPCINENFDILLQRNDDKTANIYNTKVYFEAEWNSHVIKATKVHIINAWQPLT